MNLPISYFAAKLLCEDHHGGGREEDCDLLQTRHRRERGNHVRLQVPAGGREDPLSVRHRVLSRLSQLAAYV